MEQSLHTFHDQRIVYGIDQIHDPKVKCISKLSLDLLSKTDTKMVKKFTLSLVSGEKQQISVLLLIFVLSKFWITLPIIHSRLGTPVGRC